MSKSDFVSNTLWLGQEFLKIFYSPVGVAGGFIDAFRGWKFSRSWVRFWFHFPSLVLLSTIYLIFGFSFFSRVDSRVQLFSVESEKQCPTKELEASFDQLSEAKFSKAIDVMPQTASDSKANSFTELKKRYVELLSKRILTIDPGNQVAHYRLGLIYSLKDEPESAVAKMRELARGEHGDCPQANAWMAKHLLAEAVGGEKVQATTLIALLEKAIKWKEIDIRLITFYSKLLEQTGAKDKAVSIAKQAASMRPELKLELARLFMRVGLKEEVKAAATEAEEVFKKRLDTPAEKESDRLAVAESRRMLDQLEGAEEILVAGLNNKNSGPATKRELSEIQRLLYNKSIFKLEVGGYKSDISWLEKAAKTDPLNPNISSEIANMLRLKLKPSSVLMDVLRKQLGEGTSSVETYITLAEELFMTGKVKEAMKNWDIALRKDPNNLGVLNNYGLCLAKDSEENVPRSLEMLRKAERLAPSNAEIQDTLGDILMIGKRPNEAIAKYELAIRFDMSRISTRKKLVEAYRSVGNVGMAETIEGKIKKMEAELEKVPKSEPAK